jgi:hypothetical protein
MRDAALIYMALPDEAVVVWRPVQAEKLRDHIYRILEQHYDREIERWEFEPGDVVECEYVEAFEGPILAAVRLHGGAGDDP